MAAANCGTARAPDGAPELAGLAACALFALAWLLPNHYSPWPAFHSDAVAGLALLAASFGTLFLTGGPVRWPWACAVLGGMALVPLAQQAAGKIFYFGDALMASLYLFGLALALQAGAALRARERSGLTPLLLTMLLVGLASVLMASLQWLRLNDLGIFVTDLAREGRPYANFAQPNQYATFLMLGLVACFALHQGGRLSRAALGLAVAFLGFGIVMTQSRAAALEAVGVIGLALVLRRRAGLNIGWMALLATGAWFAVLAAGWSTICEWLYLPSVRDGTMGSSNGRLDLWRELAQALMREPWWGFGWNQVSVAQASVAADVAPVRLMVEHSHSIVLDLLLWNGLPIGLLLIAAGAGWLWRHLRACRDGATAWQLAAIVALLAHALVEFPHDYAYLLFPVGLLAGAVEAGSGAGRFFATPRWAAGAWPVAGVAMLAWVTVEYFTIEDNYRDMRFETARIGTAEVSTTVPDLVLLTQLREFLYVARHPVAAGMSARDLERLRQVADRYGYPPVLLRHALAAALNGQPERAAEVMRRLCRLHVEERCIEGLDNWSAMAGSTYPQIGAVTLPPRP